MASLIDTLIDVLDKENTQYERLLDLSNTKTAAIVNGDVDKLQELLGHENLNTTQIYTHVESEGLRNAALLSPLADFEPTEKKSGGDTDN